jgi:iron complex transport system ATP-binding protein
VVSIRIDGLGVRLGKRVAVRDVSGLFDGGALVGILGPNGAGKSTLVRAMLGLVPHEGDVAIDGRPRAAMSRAEIAKRIAYLPQGQTLHWPLSVERLVALGRLPHLAPFSRLSDADQAAIDRAMARTDTAALARRIATELSGGERARVLLARALAVGAPALIADEPLASLDPAHQIEGMELLRAEADAGGLVICVLHDLTLAARFCDRVLVMHDGALVADGSPRDVLTPELLAQVYGITAFFGDGASPMLVPLDRLSVRG